MPNRIIKDSIRESYSIDSLSPSAEILFYRLITYADDFGLFKGDPKLINKSLFPLKDYKEKQVILWMDEVGKSKMVEFYMGDDLKPYGRFTKWEKHQTIRNKRPKYPECNGACFISIPELLKSIEINYNQMQSDASLESINQSESESESESKGKLVLPDYIPQDLWNDFKKHRTRLKSPMTEKAESLAFKKLQKFKDQGDNPVEIIEQSIFRGWKGLFPLKVDKTNKLVKWGKNGK